MTHSKSPPFGLIEVRPRDGVAPSGVGSIASDGEPVETDQECDRCRKMDKGIDPVDPIHDSGILQKESLDVWLPDHMQFLLQSDDLQGVVTGDFDC